MFSEEFNRLMRCIAALALVVTGSGCQYGGSRRFEIPSARSVGVPAPPPDRPAFWWGISTSPYQFEEPPSPADAFQTDWDKMAEAGKLKTARDDRVASYSHVERDLAALEYLGVTHYRFGVEWARVEPRAGQFDEQAIAHYVELARALKRRRITPIACLWHFTLPGWLCDFKEPRRHGWLHPDAEKSWERYVERMARALAGEVEYFAPQNEPNIYAAAVSLGIFPPGERMDLGHYKRLIEQQIGLFNSAARIIRDVHRGAKILSIQNIIHWERDPLDLFGLYLRLARRHNFAHLDGIAGSIDLLGFNYYHGETASPGALAAQEHRRGRRDASDLGWLIDPAGLEEQIVELARRYGKPMVIMENGIAARDDTKRQMYLFEHVLAVRRVIDAGYDLRGYFHWSLMDNFEWHEGYEPRFGLFEMADDRGSLLPRRSANLYRYLATSDFMSDQKTLGSVGPGY